MADFTKVFHKKAYPAIAPSSHLQTGRTVLISGGSSGIGFSIAESYVAADAARVIILARRQGQLDTAVHRLKSLSHRKGDEVVIGLPCDIANAEQVQKVWSQLRDRDIAVDILVLCAASGSHATLTDSSVAHTWHAYETNVLANLRLTKVFLDQGKDSDKVLLNISSAEVHISGFGPHAAYGSTKTAFASLLQHLAAEKSSSEVQIVSFHPGAVLTDLAKANGATEDMFPWDDADLPGAFAVWAASKEAAFLHGRYVWANWDVGELAAMKYRFEADPGFLKIGLQGIPTVQFAEMVEKIRNLPSSA